VSAHRPAGHFADTGTPLHLDTVDVTNNTCAGNSGGGIFAGADATLTNVNVVGNTDPGAPAAVCAPRAT